MDKFISILPTLIGAVIVVNLIAFTFMYLLANTDVVRWSDKVSYTILMILNLLFGYVGIVVPARMYGYKTESKFFKIALPVTFVLEIIILIAVFFGDYFKNYFMSQGI